MNILKKTKKQSVDFKVPMIREGILDIINHICILAGIDTGISFIVTIITILFQIKRKEV